MARVPPLFKVKEANASRAKLLSVGYLWTLSVLVSCSGQIPGSSDGFRISFRCSVDAHEGPSPAEAPGAFGNRRLR